MMRVQFEKYVQIVKTLLGWGNLTSVKGDDGTYAYLSGPFGEQRTSLISSIQSMAKLLRDINLNVTARRAEDFAETMQSPTFEWERFRQYSIEIYNTLRCECEKKLFIFVPAEKAKFYQRPHPFGERVDAAFPSTVYDAQEAGDCLALSRNTACAFHLMRVLECGLRILATRFGVECQHRNWEQVIKDIENKLADWGRANKPINEKEEFEIYSQAASHFRVFKDGYRNFTVHARGKFDEHEATRLFHSVHGFMEKLAARELSEP